MKESYIIILAKLERDKLNTEKEIKDIIDDVEMNQAYKTRYDRLIGKKHYCEELIEFFNEIVNNI